MDEGARDGDYAWVRLASLDHSPTSRLSAVLTHTCSLCSDAEFMRSVWQRYDATVADSDTSSAGGAPIFMHLISALKRLVTSRPSLLGVSAQMQGVGISASDTLPHHSHSLDSVAGMVATAASATVSNVVGMMGAEAGLSVQTAAMKVQWCVLPASASIHRTYPLVHR
jgi:hypothetical protein